MGRERTASQVIGHPDAAAFNAEQRAKQPRQRTLSEMITPVSGPRSDPESPSRIGSLVRGLDLGMGDFTNRPARYVLGKMGLETGEEGGGIARTIPEPTDALGKSIQSFGRGAGNAAIVAPFVAAGAPAMGLSGSAAAAVEMLLGGVAGLGQEELSDAGHPNLGMAAGIALGAGGGPAAVAGTSARRAGVSALDNFRLMTPEARSMARANDLSRGAMVRGSSEIKARTPDVAATINELRRVATQGARANLPAPPSSRQVTEGMEFGRGGRFYTDAERTLTTTDPFYAAKSARNYADNATEIAKRWDALSTESPDYARFLTSYDEGADVLKRQERWLWSAVDEGDRPSFNTADMVSKAKEIAGSAYFKKGNIPAAIGLLSKSDSPMTTMDLPRFQELRSVLLGVVRDARRTGLSGDKHAATMAGDMLDMMRDKMDDFARIDPTGKSAQWQAARAATLENNEFYDIGSPVIRTLEAGGQPKNLFSTLREAKGKRGARTNPVEEAQRLVRIAEQSPGGMENLRALAAEDLFSQGFNPSATKTPGNVLRRNEEMYRVVFGDSYDKALELIDLSRLHTRGSPGIAAEAYRTGSGVSPAAYMFGLAKGATNPVAAMVEGTLKMAGKQNAKDVEWQKIVRTAIEQPEFLRVLLEMPTEAAVPAWVVNWKKLVARSSARETARAGARRQSERRGVQK